MVRDLGTADIDARLEELLIDGILYAFQEQVWQIVPAPGCCTICKRPLLLASKRSITASRRTCSQLATTQSRGRQVSDDANVMLNGFGTVVNSLKGRAKPYLPQICGTIKWRLNNKARPAAG